MDPKAAKGCDEGDGVDGVRGATVKSTDDVEDILVGEIEQLQISNEGDRVTDVDANQTKDTTKTDEIGELQKHQNGEIEQHHISNEGDRMTDVDANKTKVSTKTDEIGELQKHQNGEIEQLVISNEGERMTDVDANQTKVSKKTDDIRESDKHQSGARPKVRATLNEASEIRRVCSRPIPEQTTTIRSAPSLNIQNKTNPQQSPLRIININCHSLRKNDIRPIIDSKNPDIVIATETWLKPIIKNDEIFPPDYTIWRNDRSSSQRAGGVLIAVRSTLESMDVPDLKTECEIIWTKLCLPNQKDLYICSFYNPKTSDKNSIENFKKSVKRAPLSDAAIIIGGDFNLPGIDWKSEKLKRETKINYKKKHEKTLDFLKNNGLVQLVKEPTRDENTLDLLITNLPSKDFRIEIISGISDHDAVFAEWTFKNLNEHQQNQRDNPI